MPKKNKVLVQIVLTLQIALTSFFYISGQHLKSTFRVSSVYPTVLSQDTPPFVFRDISDHFVCKELAVFIACQQIVWSEGHSFTYTLAAPLTHIYNLTTQQGEIPNSWKAATVTSLHKGRLLSDSNNFRPISFLPAVMQVLQCAINKQLHKHLMTNKLLFPSQSGLRPGYSTCTPCCSELRCLIITLYSENINKGNIIAAIILDLSKAFDKIDHSIHKTKLSLIGVRG